MASGCILGECPVCDELVWEDEEWIVDNDKIIHKKCKNEANNLEKELNLLKKKIEQLEKEIEILKNEER